MEDSALANAWIAACPALRNSLLLASATTATAEGTATTAEEVLLLTLLPLLLMLLLPLGIESIITKALAAAALTLERSSRHPANSARKASSLISCRLCPALCSTAPSPKSLPHTCVHSTAEPLALSSRSSTVSVTAEGSRNHVRRARLKEALLRIPSSSSLSACNSAALQASKAGAVALLPPASSTVPIASNTDILMAVLSAFKHNCVSSVRSGSTRRLSGIKRPRAAAPRVRTSLAGSFRAFTKVVCSCGTKALSEAPPLSNNTMRV
mmetsp:Transcript_90926/g.177995  ORF Transcript_90926/g.177995 Transcript_90926/m.177995 type:complete len:268 (-) Transcript_90926:7968-8771(-)